jgi:hypothetical protein
MQAGDKLENNNHRRATRTVHPWVYAALVGLALWFMVSVWSFAGTGVTDYLLFIVSGFVFVAVALPLILSRVRRTDDAADGDATRGDQRPSSFRDWAQSDFDTWQGRLSGMEAATQILLPVAAAAFGMMAIGIAFYIVEHGSV